MKKLFTMLLLSASCALVWGVQPNNARIVESIDYSSKELTLQSQVVLTQTPTSKDLLRKTESVRLLQQLVAPSSINSSARRSAKRVAAADLNGVEYVVEWTTSYSDGTTSKFNGGCTIKVEGDEMIFEGLARGYDVKGTYDAATGTATIPVGQVLGTHSTYGEITLYTVGTSGLVGANANITATFTDNKLTFDNYIIGRVSAGNLISMASPVGTKANGVMTMQQGANTFAAPLLVKKMNNAEITVVGISSLLYGSYYEVPFTINANDSTLTLPFGTVVDEGNDPYVLGGIVNGKLNDFILDVKVADGKSTATAAQAFLGYEKTAGSGSYSGYTFTNVNVTIDFDVLEVIPEPCPVAGNDYVLLYNDDYDDLNEGISIVQGEKGMVTVSGLVGGYDAEGSYDSKTNTIVIPTGVVVGTHSSYGDVTLYGVNGNSLLEDPIVITITEDGLTFNHDFAGIIQYNGGLTPLAMIKKIDCKKANASYTVTLGSESIKLPLLVEKVTDTKVKIVGISNLLYGAYLEVPFTLNTTDKTLVLPVMSQVDNQYKSTGYVPWYLFGVANGAVADLTLNVSTTDDSTKATASAAFYGYKNGTSYSGYNLSNVVFDMNFNILTADAAGEQFSDTPEIGGIIYKIDKDTKLATVTGCVASLTDLNIPATFDYFDNTYTVTEVATNAFQANKTITSITIPATVKTVGQDAFRNVANLASLNISDLAAWCAIEFANGNANPIYNVFPTSESKWGTVKINGEAVTTSLVIPEGFTSLGRSFYGFKSLTEISLPSTLVTIGDQCFANCTKLTDVVIPAAVNYVGSAFFGCSGLKSITSLAVVPPTSKPSGFYSVDKTIPVKVPAGSVDDYKAAAGWNEFTNIISDGSSLVEEMESADMESAIYFDLSGRKVSGELGSGVYIRVQGNKATKVMVK